MFEFSTAPLMWPCFEPILRLCFVLPVLYALSADMTNSVDYIIFMHSKSCFINVAIVSAVLLGFVIKICDTWLKTLIILTEAIPARKETVIIMGNCKGESKQESNPESNPEPNQDPKPEPKEQEKKQKKSRRNRQRSSK